MGALQLSRQFFMTPMMSLPHTYYSATRNQQLDCPPLAGHVQADVCIIGAGFTGLNTAIELAVN